MKIVAIGVGKNTYTGKEMQGCCLIHSKATFDQLKDDFDLYQKSYSANDWLGNCDINFQLSHVGMKLTGRKFKQNGENRGYNSDHGHKYDYCWEFTEVWEVIEDTRRDHEI